jgi:hypothetical protein
LHVTRPLHRRRRTPVLAIAAAMLVMAFASASLAALPADEGVVDAAADSHGHNHSRHGGLEGHLPYVMDDGLELIGEMRINQDKEGRVSDVGVLGHHAYVGAFSEPNCQKGGVYVFDLSNPARPKQVNFIRTGGQSYVGEGVQAIHIDTPEYTGDVLAMNNEICFGYRPQPSTVGGITLVDVTDPKRHRMLAEGVGDFDVHGTRANQSHSVFMWQPTPENAYAVMIDNEETTDLDILDITDPRNPELIAEYDLNAMFPDIIDDVKGAGASFSHDMIVQEVDGTWQMLASYWDGGYVVLDVTDPTDPQYVTDSDFDEVDAQLLETAGVERTPEGNAHQAEWTSDGRYIVGADEDFGPFATQSTADGEPFDGAAPGSDTQGLVIGTPLTGQAVYVGRACNGDPTPTSAATQIAVVERGVCAFMEKVANVEAAGNPLAIIVFDRQGSDACVGGIQMTVAGSTPTFGVVDRATAYGWFGLTPFDLDACRAGSTSAVAPITVGALGPEITLESYFDGWGYVRLFDANGRDDEGKLIELDTYAIPQAHQQEFAEGYGDLSVHEVATSPAHPERLYFAYYAGGFRVAEIVGDEIEEVAAYISPTGSNYWGVQVWNPPVGHPFHGRELVLASDRDYGISIFEYAGPS